MLTCPLLCSRLGPVQKIRARYLAAPAQSATLEALVENEKGEKKRTATEGLLWLIRCVALPSLLVSFCARPH